MSATIYIIDVLIYLLARWQAENASIGKRRFPSTDDVLKA